MLPLEDVLALAIAAAFGVLSIPRWRTLFGDDRKIFSRNCWTYGAVFGERLDAAIARRMALESIDRRVLWGIAACEICTLAARIFHKIRRWMKSSTKRSARTACVSS